MVILHISIHRHPLHQNVESYAHEPMFPYTHTPMSHLCSVDEYDSVRVKSNAREELEQLLERRAICLRQEETEKTKGISS